MFKKLITGVNDYLATLKCIDIALLKTCMVAVGMLIGLAVSHRHKKITACAAALAFIATCVPLLYKFIPFLKDALSSDEDANDDWFDDLNWDHMEEVEVESYE